MDRKWKLGEDLVVSDNLLDPVTFDDLVLALHCNEKVIDKAAIARVIRKIMEQRLEDMKFLLKNNTEEIIAEAMKGRGGNE